MIAKMVMLAGRKHLDQGELEQLAGLPKGRISKWKGGTGSPTVKQAVRIARVLDVDIGYLLDDAQAEPAPELTPGERSVLNVYRALRLSEEEAVTRLVAPLAGRPPTPLPPPRRPPGKRKRG